MCDKKEKRHRRETTTEKTQRDGRFVFFFSSGEKKIMRRKYKNQKQWWMFRPWSQTETKAFYRWRQKKDVWTHSRTEMQLMNWCESVDPKQQNHNIHYSLQVPFRSDGRWRCRGTRGTLNYDSGFIFTVFIAAFISSWLYFIVSLHLWIFFPTIFNFLTSTLNLQKALRRHLCLPLF